MRTSTRTSRRTAPTSRDRHLGPSLGGRRAGGSWLLAGLVLGLVLWLSGCDAGGGSVSTTRSSTERSGTRPERDRAGEHHGHGADAISPDQRGDANIDPGPDIGCASDVAGDHTTQDIG